MVRFSYLKRFFVPADHTTLKIKLAYLDQYRRRGTNLQFKFIKNFHRQPFITF